MNIKMISGKSLPMLLIPLVVLVAGCTIGAEEKPVEEMLQEMNVSQADFLAMTPCQQVEIFTTVGLRHLDRDHDTVLVPGWMNSAIDANPPEDVADCIAAQGSTWLERLEKEPQNREQNSYAIHALVYKAANSHLLIYPKVHDFVHSVVCDSNVMYPFHLTLIEYAATFKRVPDYAMERDSEDRMRSELCK